MTLHELFPAHEEEVALMEEVGSADRFELVVFNDDVNTFEHVIQTLVQVCSHTLEQAEQCTIIIHYKGKCSVKIGSMNDLTPMRQAICDRGISAEIL